MNLPTHIQFAGGQNITYRYDAAGIKLQKTVDDGTRQVTTDYMSGYQYEDGKLLFFPTPEGYVKAIYKPGDNTAPALYQYIYIYKDHLGNNRLSYTLDPESERVKILEENHYYPFGLKHNAYVPIRKDVKYQEQLVEKKEIKQIAPEEGKFKYYYQEQERQDELGLNWDSFKYRNYDYAIGRFMSIDPLAEDYPYMSTYQFAGNKPTWSREIEGLESGVDLKMRLREAAYNASKLNMTSQAYMRATNPSYNYQTAYNPARDVQGRVIIDNNTQAITHYYRGNGESVVLGPKTVDLIKNSKDVQHYISRITSGETPGPAEGEDLSVDMEGFNRGFHLGKMTFSYKTTCADGNCTTDITVDDDGFVDPNSIKSRFVEGSDDSYGSNNELGGDPYDYEPVKWSITFPNPGYQVDASGRPSAMNGKTVPSGGEGQGSNSSGTEEKVD